MPKKVLMVTGPVHSIPPLKGAAVETWMYEVSKRLIGYEPHIVSISHPCYPAREYRDGIFFHRIHFGKLYKRLFQKITKLDPFSYPKRIAHIANEIRPDIVHMHNFTRWVNPLVKHINTKGVKTILHMHNETSNIPDIKVDYFAGCSKFIVDFYKKTLVKAQHFSCIHNGVDLEKYRPRWEADSLRKDMRNRFGIKNGEFIVLFVGRLSPEKGIEHLIKSAFMLKDIKNIRFFIIGEIPRGRASNERVMYGKKIIELAAPLKDKIIFTDVFPPSKIYLLYLLGDVLVLPSNFNEPFSMAAIEAMASGLPVITREKGGLKEYIIDNFNGLFIGEESISEDIVDKIKILISDNGLREKLVMEGRKTIEKKFSWEIIVAEAEKQYRNSIKSSLLF